MGSDLQRIRNQTSRFELNSLYQLNYQAIHVRDQSMFKSQVATPLHQKETNLSMPFNIFTESAKG